MADKFKYLKKHTEALVKDVGIETACKLAGRSKATLGRYYSDAPEHDGRYMPIDAVAALEAESSYPHVTTALAEINGNSISYSEKRNDNAGGVNADVVALSERFARLMGEYHTSIQDGVISANEAKRLLAETLLLQSILVDMKLHLEDETIVPVTSR